MRMSMLAKQKQTTNLEDVLLVQALRWDRKLADVDMRSWGLMIASRAGFGVSIRDTALITDRRSILAALYKVTSTSFA